MKSRLNFLYLTIISHLSINVIFCKDFEESCASTTDCDDYEVSGLICLNGFCSCPSFIPMHYDFNEKACRINLGERCAIYNNSFDGFCPPGTACILLKHNISSTIIHISDLLTPRCRCINGIAQKKLDNTSHCVPFQEYGEKCDEVNPCDESAKVECINGTCQCALGEENMFFDLDSHRCISMANKKCLPSTCNIHSNCVPTSADICSAYEDCLIGSCQCQPGFSPTNDGKRCLGSYGQSCDSTIESRKCNHDEFLDCLNGLCLCANPMSQIYMKSTGETKCLNLIGEKCTNDHRLAMKLNCVENSVCVNGFCECEQNFVKTPLYTCLLGFNASCSHNQKLCNYFSGLGCKDGFCQCFDPHLTYDKETLSCVGDTGSFCGRIKINHEDVPVFYAHCNQTTKSVCLPDKWGEMSFCT